MFQIVEALRRTQVVTDVQVIDLIDEAKVKYVKCRAELIDGSSLHITEASIGGKSKYSYHWQDPRHQLIVRWDNIPHHPHIITFPHHRHESGGVRESPHVSIDEVQPKSKLGFGRLGF